jgi:LysM repeat protein
MNNYIECPVCKASGIKKGSPRCPRCNSDLEVFGQIENLEEGGSASSAALLIAYFLVLASVVAFSLFYLFVYKDAKAASEINLSQIKQLTTQIEGLKTENDQYLQQIIDLRTQIGGASEDILPASKTKKEEEVPTQTSQVKQAPSEVKKKPEQVKTQPVTKPVLKKQTPVAQEKKQENIKNQSGVVYHEVKPGESLRRIAQKYYGDGKMYPKIMKDNNIKQPDQIYPGQKLKIIR